MSWYPPKNADTCKISSSIWWGVEEKGSPGQEVGTFHGLINIWVFGISMWGFARETSLSQDHRHEETTGVMHSLHNRRTTPIRAGLQDLWERITPQRQDGVNADTANNFIALSSKAKHA